MTRSIPWRRRASSLLLAALLNAVVVIVFVRGLGLVGAPILASTLQVSIIRPTSSSAPLPVIPEPKLQLISPIPPLTPPPLLLPSEPLPPKVAMAPPIPSPPGPSGDAPPTYLSGPLDADAYYPFASSLGLAAPTGRVWTRVCIYSTGEIASVSLAKSSGDKELDAAALTVAHLTHWKPATVQGKPVARCSPFRVDFSAQKIGFD